MYRIFMIEDDQDILELMKNKAEKWELQIFGVKDFHQILSEFSDLQPHLVIMDIGLPSFDGYYWCTEIRKVSNVPIIFLSSAADRLNMVMAMNMGGDDFIAKPFESDVLIAKIQALLRRTYNYVNQTLLLEHRGAFLNAEKNILSYQGQNIELTKNENRIIAVLMENKGKIVSRERLMDDLWESDCYVNDSTLNVNVNRLRKKLESYGLCDFILTKFGEGYYISEGSES